MSSCLCEGKEFESEKYSYVSYWNILKKEEGFFLDTNNEYAIEIDYCPICGKKLKEKGA